MGLGQRRRRLHHLNIIVEIVLLILLFDVAHVVLIECIPVVTSERYAKGVWLPHDGASNRLLLGHLRVGHDAQSVGGRRRRERPVWSIPQIQVQT
jgi:hypothetical protein